MKKEDKNKNAEKCRNTGTQRRDGLEDYRVKLKP